MKTKAENDAELAELLRALDPRNRNYKAGHEVMPATRAASKSRRKIDSEILAALRDLAPAQNPGHVEGTKGKDKDILPIREKVQEGTKNHADFPLQASDCTNVQAQDCVVQGKRGKL